MEQGTKSLMTSLTWPPMQPSSSFQLLAALEQGRAAIFGGDHPCSSVARTFSWCLEGHGFDSCRGLRLFSFSVHAREHHIFFLFLS